MANGKNRVVVKASYEHIELDFRAETFDTELSVVEHSMDGIHNENSAPSYMV